METIHEFADYLVRQGHPSRVQFADLVEAAIDTYLKLEKRGAEDRLVFSHANKDVAEFVNRFAYEPEDWLECVRTARNALAVPEERQAFDAVFRRIGSKLAQRTRRQRENDALRKAEALWGEFPTAEARNAYRKQLSCGWRRELDTILKNRRSASPTGHLRWSELERLSSEFWRRVRDRIDSGALPKPPHLD